MFVIISDIFTVFGLITSLIIISIGLIINSGFGINLIIVISILFSFVYILLTFIVYVSYVKGRGNKFKHPAFVLLIVGFVWAARIAFLLFSLSVFSAQKDGFTELPAYSWQIQPTIKSGMSDNSYILCMLQDSRYCVRIKVSNLLFYQSYSMCNIRGDLFYKDIRKLKTYDYLKKTFLNGYDLELECRETFFSKIFNIRDNIIGRINEIVPRPQSTLLNGIIFGIDVGFYPKFDNAIRAAGISHIVAASGYNVNILLSAVSPFTSKLGKRIGSIVSLCLIWFYALLTGFSSSMVRACSMSSVLILSKLLKLKIEIGRIFFLAFSVLVFINPLIMFDLGFLLSASATFGIIYLYPILENLIRVSWFPHSTVACTLVTLPITFFYFNTFSPYAVIANVLILPVIEIVMLLGVFGLIIKPLLYIAWGCLRYVELIAVFISKMPFSVINIPADISILLCIGLIFLIFVMIYRNKQ